MKSLLKTGNVVTFPEFTKERAYMVPFKKGEKLPEQYSRWQDTVDSMLDGVDADDVIYMTIDQGEVEKGTTHRRGGAHIDGVYTIAGWDTGPSWITKDCAGGGIILASDQIGAKAYEGEFADDIGEGGDCSHMDLSHATVHVLKPNQVYVGNVSMVHETIPAAETHNRTFVRLILPESYAFAA